MPDFNTFRTNKLLLGQVLVARQNVDLSATENDHLEVRQFLHELEEKKRKEKTTLFLRFIGFLGLDKALFVNLIQNLNRNQNCAFH